MGMLRDIYDPRVLSPLAVDAYHITTLYAYWVEGRASNTYVAYAFGRKEPQGGGYGVVAGIENTVELLKLWQENGFTDDDIAYLRRQKTSTGRQKYPDDFLAWLKDGIQEDFKKIRIDAIPDGGVFFPQEPVARFQGPLGAVKLLESPVLSFLNGKVATVTRATRIAHSLETDFGNGSPVGAASTQGYRRGPSIGHAIESSADLEVGGFKSTSTGQAAFLFDQKWAGTMDHAWVQNHENEIGDVSMAELFQMRDEGRIDELREALRKDAFRAYAFAHPEDGILLCDTYDPVQGMDNAIQVIKELRELGYGQNYGVRFDSADLVGYSRMALRKFTAAGFTPDFDVTRLNSLSDDELLLEAGDICTVFCAAADGLDEFTIAEMRAAGAYFRAYGVGTAGSHSPPAGLVFKAAAIVMQAPNETGEEYGDLHPVMKICTSEPAKASNPGVLNARRYYNADGTIAYTVVYDENLGLDPLGFAVNMRNFDEEFYVGSLAYEDALVPVMREGGVVLYNPPQRPRHEGGTEAITDYAAQNRFVRSELAKIPEALKVVQKSPDDVAKDTLLKWFRDAQKAGHATFEVSVEGLSEILPPKAAKMPVYIDRNLLLQRRNCENAHLHKNATGGVGEYAERFAPN